MFEKLLEKSDFRKYDLPSSSIEQLGNFLEKDEFVEIGVQKHSLLGIKKQSGKEVLHTQNEASAAFLRTIRDQFGEWEKISGISFQTERQFNIHANKSSLMDMVRQKLGANFKFNKTLVNQKVEAINQKLKKIHDRLQGVFIVFSEINDILNGFDTKVAVFACKTNTEENVDEINWIKDVKKANLLVVCPDTKHHHVFLSKNGCQKLKVGRVRNKNIWLRHP